MDPHPCSPWWESEPMLPPMNDILGDGLLQVSLAVTPNPVPTTHASPTPTPARLPSPPGAAALSPPVPVHETPLSPGLLLFEGSFSGLPTFYAEPGGIDVDKLCEDLPLHGEFCAESDPTGVINSAPSSPAAVAAVMAARQATIDNTTPRPACEAAALTTETETCTGAGETAATNYEPPPLPLASLPESPSPIGTAGVGGVAPALPTLYSITLEPDFLGDLLPFQRSPMSAPNPSAPLHGWTSSTTAHDQAEGGAKRPRLSAELSSEDQEPHRDGDGSGDDGPGLAGVAAAPDAPTKKNERTPQWRLRAEALSFAERFLGWTKERAASVYDAMKNHDIAAFLERLLDTMGAPMRHNPRDLPLRWALLQCPGFFAPMLAPLSADPPNQPARNKRDRERAHLRRVQVALVEALAIFALAHGIPQPSAYGVDDGAVVASAAQDVRAMVTQLMMANTRSQELTKWGRAVLAEVDRMWAPAQRTL